MDVYKNRGKNPAASVPSLCPLCFYFFTAGNTGGFCFFNDGAGGSLIIFLREADRNDVKKGW